jgi:hypothetical protein
VRLTVRSEITWVVLTVALCGADCEHAGGTVGKSNHYEFDVEGQGATPKLLDNGTHVAVTTSPMTSGCGDAPPPYSRVESSDATVASFALLSDGTIAATTFAAGSADLELLDDQGHVVDSVAIDVEAIGSLQMPTDVTPVQVIAAGSGQTYSLVVTALDAVGDELAIGSDRIEVATTGEIAASVDPQVGVQSFAPGAATVIASVDGVSATATIDSIGLADVTAIEIGTGSAAPMYEPDDDEWLVWLTPMTATGPVLGAACTWQLSDPTVQLVDNVAALSAYNPIGGLHDFALFTTTRTGSVTFTATCTIGSVQTTVTLQR